ncbi:TPA: hypothetical protein ACX6S8_001573 [Photobacterium damselae]
MLSKKKSKFDAEAAKAWLNSDVTDKTPTITAKPKTVARYESEWNAVNSFSMNDKKAVNEAKKRHQEFLEKYSRKALCFDNIIETVNVEHSDVEQYYDFISCIENFTVKNQVFVNEIKSKLDIKHDDNYKKHVYFSLEYKNLLHDALYHIKKADSILYILANSKVDNPKCDLIEHDIELIYESSFFHNLDYVISLDFDSFVLSPTDDELELDIADMALFKQYQNRL